MRSTRLALLALGLSSCGSSTTKPTAVESAPVPSGTAAPAASATPAPEPSDVLGFWKGAWLSWMPIETDGATSAAGEPVAVELRGDSATLFDGKTEHSMKLRVASPCSIELSAPTENSDGSRDVYEKTFVLSEDGYVIGEGAAGVRNGKAATVCDGRNLYQLDASGKCNVSGRWVIEKELKCVWSKEDGKDVLTIEHDFPLVLTAKGDTLVSDKFQTWEREGYERKVADFTTAKQLAGFTLRSRDDARNTDPTPAKPQSLATIRDIVLAAKSDAKANDGKSVSIRARVARVGWWSSGAMSLDLVDKPGFAKPSVECTHKAPLQLALWDTVAVSGKLDIRGDDVEIGDCKVVLEK